MAIGKDFCSAVEQLLNENSTVEGTIRTHKIELLSSITVKLKKFPICLQAGSIYFATGT